MNPETTPQRLMSFSSPLVRLVFIVAVSPETSTSMMLSYHDVLKSGTPKTSSRYCLMACERESSVFAVDCANLISGVDFMTGVELVLNTVLADANGVKKSVVMKTGTIEKINRRVMCFMFALLCIVVSRHKFVCIPSYHRIFTEERDRRTEGRKELGTRN